MEKQIKDLRQLVRRAGSEIYRRKHWRKATRKEKRIVEELKRKASGNLNKLKDLMIRRKIVKMERCKETDKNMKNNSICQKDEGNFYKKKNER